MTFEDLVRDIKEARNRGEQILKDQGVENVDLGQQNVMLQFWQIEAVIYEVERLRGFIADNSAKAREQHVPPGIKLESNPTVKAIPFNKNLPKKDTQE